MYEKLNIIKNKFLRPPARRVSGARMHDIVFFNIKLRHCIVVYKMILLLLSRLP